MLLNFVLLFNLFWWWRNRFWWLLLSTSCTFFPSWPFSGMAILAGLVPERKCIICGKHCHWHSFVIVIHGWLTGQINHGCTSCPDREVVDAYLVAALLLSLCALVPSLTCSDCCCLVLSGSSAHLIWSLWDISAICSNPFPCVSLSSQIWALWDISSSLATFLVGPSWVFFWVSLMHVLTCRSSNYPSFSWAFFVCEAAN